MKTTSEMIAVMQAYERGEEIESCFHDGRHLGIDPDPKWNWAVFDYRVKPKPITREVTVYMIRITGGSCVALRLLPNMDEDIIARKTITITEGEGL